MTTWTNGCNCWKHLSQSNVQTCNIWRWKNDFLLLFNICHLQFQFHPCAKPFLYIYCRETFSPYLSPIALLSPKKNMRFKPGLETCKTCMTNCWRFRICGQRKRCNKVNRRRQCERVACFMCGIMRPIITAMSCPCTCVCPPPLKRQAHPSSPSSDAHTLTNRHIYTRLKKTNIFGLF